MSMPVEQRAKISAALKGHVISPEQRVKLSVALLGHKVSPETLVRICAANSNPSPERRAKISRTLWKGGKKVVSARHHAVRRILGFVPLNEPFDGCEGHHIDKEHIVYIPKELHRSISHNVFTGWNMAEINALVLSWIPDSLYDLIPHKETP